MLKTFLRAATPLLLLATLSFCAHQDVAQTSPEVKTASTCEHNHGKGDCQCKHSEIGAAAATKQN